jgi:hypothetical protein
MHINNLIMNNNRKAINLQTASLEEIRRAFYQKTPIQGVKILAVHPGAHAEEIGVPAVCYTGYAEHSFPGIKKASVGTLTTTALNEAKNDLPYGQRNPKGLFFYLLKEHKILAFGIGGGLFDEHGKEGEESSLMMFCKHLGIEKKPELQSLLRYLNWEDCNGNLPRHVKETETASKKVINAAGKFLFPEMVKRRWRRVRNSPEEIVNQAILSMIVDLEDVILEAQEFPRAMKELRGEVEYRFLPKRYPNKKGKRSSELAIVRTDEPQAQGVVWCLSSKRKNVPAAMIQINSTGQFQVIANQAKPYEVKLSDVVKMLRMKEFEARGERVPSWKDLGGESVEGSVIHYQIGAERIYNGSLTQPDVPPLIARGLLSVENVIEAVMVGLQEFHYDKVNMNICGNKDGICPVKQSGGEVKCQLYPAGLFRCYKTQKLTASTGKPSKRVKRKANTPTQLEVKLKEAMNKGSKS